MANLTTATECGRLRTMHRSGPLIDITTSRKGHLFFNNLANRDTVRHAMSGLSRQELTNGQGRFLMNLIEAGCRIAPQNGDFHYEYTVPAGQPNSITRRHASGGQVNVNIRPTQDQMVKLIDRLLGDDCAIEINRAAQYALGGPVVRPAVVNPAAYLNSL